jgi:hypothetical protein
MEINLMNMSAIELDNLEQSLAQKLDIKLRNMVYDDELEELYQQIEEVNLELKRRGQKVNG